jgi:hypothetical protein
MSEESAKDPVSVVDHRDVVETGDTRAETKVATSSMVVSPGQMIAGVLGVVLAVIGIMAVSRGGIDSSMNVPMVRTAGLDQSAMLGTIELGLGLLLILGAMSYATRDLIVGIGGVMILGGVILGAANATILRDMGTVHQTAGRSWSAASSPSLPAAWAGSSTRVTASRPPERESGNR